MNYNTIGYLIYMLFTVFITVYVGYLCHKNGHVFMCSIFSNDQIATAVNNILLTAYYLLNIGYAILMIKNWPMILSVGEMLNELSTNIGQIVLLLAALHYVNIFVLMVGQNYINKKQIKI